MLKKLLENHLGQELSKRWTRDVMFLPGMPSQIDEMVEVQKIQCKRANDSKRCARFTLDESRDRLIPLEWRLVHSDYRWLLKVFLSCQTGVYQINNYNLAYEFGIHQAWNSQRWYLIMGHSIQSLSSSHLPRSGGSPTQPAHQDNHNQMAWQKEQCKQLRTCWRNLKKMVETPTWQCWNIEILK